MNTDFFTHLEAAALSKGTVKQRRHHLAALEKFIGRSIDDASTEELENFIAQSGSAREYKRALLSSIRAYYGYLQARGVRPDNPALLLQRIKPTMPRPRPTSDIDLKRAKHDADPQELVMLRLGAECGLRRFEIAHVHERDLCKDLFGNTILEVHGKGGKFRAVPIHPELEAAMRRLLREHGGGWLFPGDIDGHISAAWVGKRLSRLLPDGVTSHSLRHRFATKVYSSSRDILATQQLLGHSSPATTQLYVAVDSSRLREVARAAVSVDAGCLRA